MSFRSRSYRSAHTWLPVPVSTSWAVTRTRAGSSDTAVNDILDAEFAADIAHIDGTALIGKGGVAGDNEQFAEARQLGDDVLGDAVREILLRRIARHVGERQHGDGGLVGCPFGRRDRNG